MLAFARRCTKEILRDPATIFFGLGFPLILLLLLSTLQKNIPTPLFEINDLAPGICVFALSFFSLFAATLVAKDRESAFLQRLYTTPLTAADFILGYTLPMIPIALAEGVACYLCAMLLGLEFSLNILLKTAGGMDFAVSVLYLFKHIVKRSIVLNMRVADI